MKEVSCRAFETLQWVVERRGFTLEQLTEGTLVSAAHLRDKSNWLTWASFAVLMRRMEELCGDGEALERDISNAFLKQAPSFSFIRNLAGMLISPERLYRFFCLHGEQMVFPIVRPSVEKLSRNRLRWTLSVPPDYPEAPMFFRVGYWNCVNLPTLLGMGPTTVAYSYSAGRAVYEIVIPRPATLRYRVRNVLRMLLFSERVLDEEISAREAELLRNYDDLNRSRHALKELNINLERIVGEKTQELVARNREIVEERVHSAYAAGMAEIASEVIHNVGNSLTSATVSLDLVLRSLNESRVPRLRQAIGLLDQYIKEAEAATGENDRGGKFVAYLAALSETLETEQNEMQVEVERARDELEALSAIVARQDEYTRPSQSHTVEEVSLDQAIDDLLGLEETSLAQAGIEVHRRFAAHQPIRLDRMKFTRVLLKLIKFSRETMRNSPTRILDIEIDEIDNQVRVRLSNTGDAALPADPTSLFVPDSSLRRTGAHDLHFCGNIVIEMGGSIRVTPRDDQPGATFTLEFPTTPRQVQAAAS